DDAHAKASTGSVTRFERLSLPVPRLESLANVPQATPGHLPVLAHGALSVVGNVDVQRAARDSCGDGDAAAALERLDPVLDGILQTRLQDHVRDQDRERLVVDRPLDGQPVAKARGLNVDVATQKVELLLERD